MNQANPKKLGRGVFVVTGGTQGLGEAIAMHLAELGAAAVVICGRNEEKGRKVEAALSAAGTSGLYIQADLLKVVDCRRVIAACDDRFGSLSGLVNAGASTARGTIVDTTVDDWDKMMALNLRAPFILMQESIKIMKREGKGGSIVNILSVSAHGGQPKLTAYCTSKGALLTLTKNVAHAVRDDHIRVNGLNIGWMATPGEHKIQKAEGAPDNWLEIADGQAPFGRILRPHEVARLVAFLLSSDGEMMTGSAIDYDQMVIGAFD
jgi:NAD(P)-dependent dehydrogenase (short-subunit alcohol dehydrogenase family)